MNMKIDDNGTIRDMTKDELANLEEIKQDFAEREQLEKDRAKLKQDVLIKLGLTVDEAAALFG